jgi:hypothetical protein
MIFPSICPDQILFCAAPTILYVERRGPFLLHQAGDGSSLTFVRMDRRCSPFSLSFKYKLRLSMLYFAHDAQGRGKFALPRCSHKTETIKSSLAKLALSPEAVARE